MTITKHDLPPPSSIDDLSCAPTMHALNILHSKSKHINSYECVVETQRNAYFTRGATLAACRGNEVVLPMNK